MIVSSHALTPDDLMQLLLLSFVHWHNASHRQFAFSTTRPIKYRTTSGFHDVGTSTECQKIYLVSKEVRCAVHGTILMRQRKWLIILIRVDLTIIQPKI